MIILYIFGAMVALNGIIDIIKLLRESYKEVIAEERQEQQAFYVELQRQREQWRAREEKERERREYKTELCKQRDAVQYQLKLLEKLDDFRPPDPTTETSIKKALAMEKQYNALAEKERKLKQKIKELEDLKTL